MTRNNANRSNIRKFGHIGLLLTTTLLLMAVPLDSPRMNGEAETIDASEMSTATAMAKIIRFYLRVQLPSH